MTTIEQQVEEFDCKFYHEHEERGLTYLRNDVVGWLRTALQERDRIAREERDRYWKLALNTPLNEATPDSPESLLIERTREERDKEIANMVADILDLFSERGDVVSMGAILEVASRYGITEESEALTPPTEEVSNNEFRFYVKYTNPLNTHYDIQTNNEKGGEGEMGE